MWLCTATLCSPKRHCYPGLSSYASETEISTCWTCWISNLSTFNYIRQVTTSISQLDQLNTDVMRLFLLPVSTRRTLIYCERIQEQLNGAKPSIHDRVVNKANETWTSWEKSETKWKLRLTEYGNRIFNRIDYREWGLKTLPHTLNKDSFSTIEVLYPSNFLKGDRIPSILKAIATERQGLHQKNMYLSVAAMPLTIPVGLLPVYVNQDQNNNHAPQ